MPITKKTTAKVTSKKVAAKKVAAKKPAKVTSKKSKDSTTNTALKKTFVDVLADTQIHFAHVYKSVINKKKSFLNKQDIAIISNAVASFFYDDFFGKKSHLRKEKDSYVLSICNYIKHESKKKVYNKTK